MASEITRGRRIGLDFGEVRIGVSLSDLDSILVSPLATLTNDEKFKSNFKKILAENMPVYIAIGWPIHLSGSLSAKSQSVKDFAAALKSYVDVPIYLIDERLTTTDAYAQMRDAGKSMKQSKEIIDQLAAVGILNLALSLEKSDKGLGNPI